MQRHPKTVNFWVDRLPHWEVEDGRYFITMHVSGAIPEAGRIQIREVADRLRNCQSQASPDWLNLQRRIFGAMERWLDRVQQNAWMNDQRLAEMLAEAIDVRQQRGRWNVFSYVIMPNHLHFFCEIPAGDLKPTMEDFKRWTGHEGMKLLRDAPDRFWQREWFDHWSRSDEQDDRILAYIRTNPEKSQLPVRFTRLPYFRGPAA